MNPAAIGIVLLAAGRARRFGAAKQLASLGGVPMVRRIASTAIQCAKHVVVVTGAYSADVETCLADLDARLAPNRHWQEGMGSSIACGVTHLQRIDVSFHACIIMLADQPLVTASDVAALIAAHHEYPNCIIASRYDDGTRGAPCLFPCDFFDELARLEGPQGAKSLLRRHSDRIHTVPIPHAGMDIDTPADVQTWIRRNREKGVTY